MTVELKVWFRFNLCRNVMSDSTIFHLHRIPISFVTSSGSIMNTNIFSSPQHLSCSRSSSTSCKWHVSPFFGCQPFSLLFHGSLSLALTHAFEFLDQELLLDFAVL